MFGLIKSFFAGPPKLPPEEMARVKGIVDNFIASSPIAIFSKSYCPYCNRAKSVLSSQPGVHPDQLKVIELDHESDGPAIQQALAQREGKSSVTVPQIYIRQTHIGGSDDLMAAQRSGQLEKLLKGA